MTDITIFRSEVEKLRVEVEKLRAAITQARPEVEDAHRRESCAADLAREWEQHCRTAEAENTRLRALISKENINAES